MQLAAGFPASNMYLHVMSYEFPQTSVARSGVFMGGEPGLGRATGP